MAQRSGAPRPRPVLEALDLNHDGKLSSEEIQAAPASLRKLDRNEDGVLTEDEMQPQRADAGASADELVTQLMSFDRNKDGVLTPDELPERMRSLFTRADTDKDGKLTPDEIRRSVGRTGPPRGRPTGGGNAMMRLDPVVDALDADHDGIISAEEIKMASKNLLTLDKNGDGFLDADELKMRQQSPADRVAHMLDEFDTNKDGKLSREEVPDGMRERFADADKNGDGFLDAAELLQMYSAMPQGGPGRERTSAPGAPQPKGENK